MCYANRIKDLGSGILEGADQTNAHVAKKFKEAVESDLKNCFKRGLKPKIGQRFI